MVRVADWERAPQGNTGARDDVHHRLRRCRKLYGCPASRAPVVQCRGRQAFAPAWRGTTPTRGLPSAGRADLARLPARAPRSTLPPAGRRGATESRVSLLFRRNSAPRRGFERIESGGSAAEAAFGANRGPAARPARNSRRVLIYFSYPLPNRLLKQTSWPRMNTDEHGFEECKCFAFNPRSSAFNFGHHNHVSIENIGVTLRGPAPVF